MEHTVPVANGSYANQDARREQVMAVLIQAYGHQAAPLWFQRWRMFWMSCADLFGYADGQEWLVAWLKSDYSQMIVARDARDYMWVFARTPAVSLPDYAALIAKVQALAYPLGKIRKVPQAKP